jgi:hypothetical protein
MSCYMRLNTRKGSLWGFVSLFHLVFLFLVLLFFCCCLLWETDQRDLCSEKVYGLKYRSQ